jgi:hypothetical protein
MSYILDALTRSQKQRERSRIPTLTTGYPIEGLNHAGPHSWPRAGIGLATVAVAVAIVLYAVSGELLEPFAKRTYPTVEHSMSNTVATQPATVAARAEPDMAGASSMPSRPGNDAVERLARESANADAGKAPGYVSPTPKRSTAKTPSATTGVLAHSPGKTPGPRPKPESRRLADELLTLRRELEHNPSRTQASSQAPQTVRALPERQDSGAGERPGGRPSVGLPAENAGELPKLRELPLETRAAIPPLEINVHAFAPARDERMVMINMKRYGEGDRLREGPLLDAITPTGVVLVFEGKRFQLETR